MSVGQRFQKHIKVGGQFKSREKHRGLLTQEAEDFGLAVVVADCDRARSRSAVLRAIAKAVDYPQFFGNDLDALYDCLRETVMEQKIGVYLWLDRLHTADEVIGQATEEIIDTLNDVTDYSNNKDRVFVYTINHAGKHEAPEPGVSPEPYLRGDD